MSEKKVNARVLNKHDTRTNWDKATGFIPKAGEIIIYDKDLEHGDDSGYPKFKVGNDIDSVIDLPFAAGAQGIQGIQGDKGDKGDKGDPGKSAYETAKEGGYTGTEEEFAVALATERKDHLCLPSLFAVAHRGHVEGAGATANETIADFQNAINHGYKFLEADVHVTADSDDSKRFILWHNDKIGNLTIATSTFDALQGATSVDIATLDEFLVLCKKYDAVPVVEMKGGFANRERIQELIQKVEQYDLTDRAFLTSFDYRDLLAASGMNPYLNLVWWRAAGQIPSEWQFVNEIGKCKTPNNRVYIGYEVSTELDYSTTLDLIKTYGLAGIIAHTVDDESRLNEIIPYIAGFITNDILPLQQGILTQLKKVSGMFNANGDAAAEHGISYVIASGTADAVSPAYTETTLASGITLKKGKGYRFSASVDRGTTTAKTVWVSLKDASGNQLKSITLSTSVDTSSLDFSLTTDYNDAYISFKTEVTNGYAVSANLELTAEGGSERYSPNTEFISDDFVNGDATFWNGGATINYGAKYRVTCTLGTMYKYAQDVHIKAADGFKFVIGYYNDGACTSESGWQSEITVPANQQFRIMIQRATPNTSEVADVAEFVSKLRIYTNGLKEIYDLANKNNTQEETTNVAENPCACVKPFEVLSISHRGYNRVAPENTLAAFKLSKKNGFDFVECDVRFTSDGVPVLLHDASINRTARNADGSEISSTINIADITYETALTYDFGIWKGEEYAGTKIPTLAEFMQLCRALSLYPYLDLYEAYSATQAQAICDVIKSCGMERNVTFMSASSGIWNYMSNVMPEARYGLVSWEADPTTGTNIADYIDTLRAKGVKNIFAMGDRNIMDTSLFIAMCKEKGVALETYSPNTAEEILALDPFISGIISDTLVAKDVLRYTDDEAQIKVGNTTITETQLQNLLSLLNNIYDGSVSFLITFKIDDVEYQAEEGMTWGEWCDSEYNLDDYYISSAMGNQVCAEALIPVSAEGDTPVYDVDTIIENHRYYT